MADSCCATERIDAHNDPRWRRVLWMALAINVAMFAVEIAAGVRADSRALQADAIDFLGDAGNYAVSLAVAPMALAWRARAAVLKGATMLAFGIGVVAVTVWSLIAGTAPRAETMGAVGLIALLANVAVALMLFRFRSGDANMRSVWICSRNDAIGNVAVMAAAVGVLATGEAWPDLLVAAAMAGLAVSGSLAVLRQARGELRPEGSAAHG
jgi:Co/Zn/Cd efflux system component